MPARTTTSAAVAKRFELPALEFKFASLTDGTDIPPPLPSPVKEVPTPPQTPPPGDVKEVNGNGVQKTNGVNGREANGTNGTNGVAGLKRPADDSPLSPALSSRQGSIRRLFSKNLLNNAYAEGETVAPNGKPSMNGTRPGSRSGSVLDDKKAKRGSGWFRRLRTGDAASKRSSALYEDAGKKSSTPPPPMIPELSALEAKVDLKEEGSLGSDLFKNIK
jgi:hypothetical protein